MLNGQVPRQACSPAAPSASPGLTAGPLVPAQTPYLGGHGSRMLWTSGTCPAALPSRAAGVCGAASAQPSTSTSTTAHMPNAAHTYRTLAPPWPCAAFRRGRRYSSLRAAAGLGQPGAPPSQQSRNGPSNSSSSPLSTDLLSQRLERARDVTSVLQMLKQPRNTAAGADEQAVVCTAALKALTRLLQTPAPRPMGDTASGAAAPPAAAALLGRGGRLLSREEIQELQDAVRGMVSELHSRRGMLSFPLLSVALTSLEVLLPALGGSWRAAGVRPDDAAGRLLELVAELPRAAADADKVQLVPLPALRDAFRAGLRLTQMTQPLLQQQASYAAPGRPGPVAQQQVVGQEVRAYLRRAVFATAGGSDDAGGQAETAAAVDAAAAAARLQGADLAAMAAAAELAVMWDMEVAPAVMQLHVRHVDRLLAAAAAGPAYELTGSADHQPLARVGTSSGDDEGPSTSYRTAGRGHGRATREALGGARSRGRQPTPTPMSPSSSPTVW